MRERKPYPNISDEELDRRAEEALKRMLNKQDQRAQGGGNAGGNSGGQPGGGQPGGGQPGGGNPGGQQRQRHHRRNKPRR